MKKILWTLFKVLSCPKPKEGTDINKTIFPYDNIVFRKTIKLIKNKDKTSLEFKTKFVKVNIENYICYQLTIQMINNSNNIKFKN